MPDPQFAAFLSHGLDPLSYFFHMLHLCRIKAASKNIWELIKLIKLIAGSM
jgi:hypothetical protein